MRCVQLPLLSSLLTSMPLLFATSFSTWPPFFWGMLYFLAILDQWRFYIGDHGPPPQIISEAVSSTNNACNDVHSVHSVTQILIQNTVRRQLPPQFPVVLWRRFRWACQQDLNVTNDGNSNLPHKTMPTLSIYERDRVHGSRYWWAWSFFAQARFARSRAGCAPLSGSATVDGPLNTG